MPIESIAVPSIMEKIACLSQVYGLDDASPLVHHEATCLTQSRNNEQSHSETMTQASPHGLSEPEARTSSDTGALAVQQHVSNWVPNKKRLQNLAMVALLLAFP